MCHLLRNSCLRSCCVVDGSPLGGPQGVGGLSKRAGRVRAACFLLWQKKCSSLSKQKGAHTRLSKSALATATRLTMPCHKCSPNRVQAHTLRLFSPKHSITPLPPCQSELDSPRLPPASAARLLWTSSAAPRGREGVCPGREVARPRTANPV